jgi:hypothetical protein
MAKYSRTSGVRKSSGTVTVIEARVHRSWARNARIGYILTALTIGALLTAVASQWLSPVLSVLAGFVVGNIVGGLVWVAIRLWPIVRVLWWWLPELVTGTTLLAIWTLLVGHTPLAIRLTVMLAVVSIVAVPNMRRSLAALGWCFIVRHRLRTCFAQFIVANRSGSLPLILAARPTPVGERVWIYLRPGLSISDLESRLEKIAVACHASTVIVDRASTRTAAFVRVDVKRREVLTGLVSSPLVDLVDPATPASLTDTTTPADMSTLDLPNVSADGPAKPRPTPTHLYTPTPAAAGPAATPASVKKVPVTVGATEDYSDWID